MPSSQASLWSEICADRSNWRWGHLAALAGFASVLVYVLSIHSLRLATGLSAVCLAVLTLPLVLVDFWLMIRRRARFHGAFAVVAAMSAIGLTTLAWAGGESAFALTAAVCCALVLFLSRVPRVEVE